MRSIRLLRGCVHFLRRGAADFPSTRPAAMIGRTHTVQPFHIYSPNYSEWRVCFLLHQQARGDRCGAGGQHRRVDSAGLRARVGRGQRGILGRAVWLCGLARDTGVAGVRACEETKFQGACRSTSFEVTHRFGPAFGRFGALLCGAVGTHACSVVNRGIAAGDGAGVRHASNFLGLAIRYATLIVANAWRTRGPLRIISLLCLAGAAWTAASAARTVHGDDCPLSK